MSKLFLLACIAAILAVSLNIFMIHQRDVAQSQGSLDPLSLLSGDYDAANTRGEYYGKSVASSLVPLSIMPKTVLGSGTADRRIEVDLTNQRLYGYEGDQLVYNFLISSGKWGKTPTGTFTIWSKFRYKRMSGGSKELHTYYNLPNVPFTMFFANTEVPASRGFGIHGTYWHDNFGHPMSHGCINMRTAEAEQIYNWAGPDTGGAGYTKATDENPGTTVVIFGVAPRE